MSKINVIATPTQRACGVTTIHWEPGRHLRLPTLLAVGLVSAIFYFLRFSAYLAHKEIRYRCKFTCIKESEDVSYLSKRSQRESSNGVEIWHLLGLVPKTMSRPTGGPSCPSAALAPRSRALRDHDLRRYMASRDLHLGWDVAPALKERKLVPFSRAHRPG